jgi:bifunctional DNase/RNase
MFVEMKVAGITVDPFSNSPIVILKEVDGNKALPIWIGVLEASAIAAELGNVKPPRPMTHDLMRDMLRHLSVKVDKIEVNDLKDNTFYATIHISIGDKSLAIDSRPSDAMALALRTESPIFVSEEVIKESRTIDLEKAMNSMGDEKHDAEKWSEILENLSPEDFGKYKM